MVEEMSKPMIGSLVVPTSRAVFGNVLHSDDTGVVIGHCRNPDLIRVRKNGLKTAVSYHVDFWRVCDCIERRKRLWHARQENGNCVRCGAPRSERSTQLCDQHFIEQRQYFVAHKKSKVVRTL